MIKDELANCWTEIENLCKSAQNDNCSVFTTYKNNENYVWKITKKLKELQTLNEKLCGMSNAVFVLNGAFNEEIYLHPES